MPGVTTDRPPRAQNFGQRNRLSVVFAVLIFVGNLLLGYHRAVAAAEGHKIFSISLGGRNIFEALQIALGMIIVFGFVGWIVAFKAAKLARTFPSAIVLSTAKHKSMASLMRERLKAQSGSSGWVWIPQMLALKADTEGIEIWGGQRNFRVIYAEQWSQIGFITSTRIVSGSHVFQGLSLPISHGSTELNMPLMVAGGGPFGLMSMSAKRLNPIIDAMNHLRAPDNS